MFQTKVVEEIKTHILFSVTFLRKPWRLWDNLEKKYCRAGLPTDENMAHGRWCWIPKATNTHSEKCNTYCFSTATMVALTCLNDVVICELLVLLGADLSQIFRRLVRITSELLVAITNDEHVKQSWVQIWEQAFLQNIFWIQTVWKELGRRRLCDLTTWKGGQNRNTEKGI